MKEIGGYFELDTYRMPMLHEGAIALNCGRSCLTYLIETRKIRKILLPYFLCDSVESVCRKYGVAVRKYHIGENFKPEPIVLQDGEWLYLVNFYGQLTEQDVVRYKDEYRRIIVDNVQA